jgi:hypothetical protein
MFVRTLIGRNAGTVVEIEHLAAVQMLEDGRAELPEATDGPEPVIDAESAEAAPGDSSEGTGGEEVVGEQVVLCPRCEQPKHRGRCKKGPQVK